MPRLMARVLCLKLLSFCVLDLCQHEMLSNVREGVVRLSSAGLDPRSSCPSASPLHLETDRQTAGVLSSSAALVCPSQCVLRLCLELEPGKFHSIASGCWARGLLRWGCLD